MVVGGGRGKGVEFWGGECSWDFSCFGRGFARRAGESSSENGSGCTDRHAPEALHDTTDRQTGGGGGREGVCEVDRGCG